MSLILTALTAKGVVIAADRRTVATHNQTGEFSILTDDAEKLFLGPDIVIALLGSYDIKKTDPASQIENWIVETYASTKAFLPQVQQFWEEFFRKGNNGGFVAVCYRDLVAQSFRFDGKGEPIITQLSDTDRAKLQFNGSGNQIANQIINHLQPSIASMDLNRTAQLLIQVIHKTHATMIESGAARVSVGPKAIVALINSTGARFFDNNTQ